MRNIFKNIRGIKVLKNESLSKHTSFRIGGQADYFIKIYSRQGLVKVLKVIKKEHLRYLVIGAGTNILFDDRGFKGVVIRLAGAFRRISQNRDSFRCGAAVLLDDFINKARNAGYGGAEFLAGIPGTIGGAISGNAGAWGHSISEIIKKVTVMDMDLKEQQISRGDLGFDYRSCRLAKDLIIISGVFKLKRKRKSAIIKACAKNVRERKKRQPDGLCAGSFFKNPEGSSAGKLIDECGLKGLRIGDAMVSPKHGNFIINCGAAKSSQIIRLMKIIKRTVKEKKGYSLEPEVRIVRC